MSYAKLGTQELTPDSDRDPEEGRNIPTRQQRKNRCVQAAREVAVPPWARPFFAWKRCEGERSSGKHISGTRRRNSYSKTPSRRTRRTEIIAEDEYRFLNEYSAKPSAQNELILKQPSQVRHVIIVILPKIAFFSVRKFFWAFRRRFEPTARSNVCWQCSSIWYRRTRHAWTATLIWLSRLWLIRMTYHCPFVFTMEQTE